METYELKEIQRASSRNVERIEDLRKLCLIVTLYEKIRSQKKVSQNDLQ